MTLAWLLPLAARGEESPLRLVEKDGQPVAIEARGLAPSVLGNLAKLPADDPGWAHILGVYVGSQEGGDKVPAMAGTYLLRGDMITFTPSFSFRHGLSYLVVYYPPPAGPEVSPARYERVFTIPAPPASGPARVIAVYPSADTLPENQLRFYLQFSAPMSRGEIYSHLKLLKADGSAVKFPFLEIGEELWDASGTRLTLLVDPGRIKRGLRPREEDGPVLEAGGKYTLVIDGGFHNAVGRPLAAGHEKSFTAIAPVETAIEPNEWKVTAPPAGTREPLVLKFPRPLDHALLERTIAVTDQRGKAVSGKVEVAAQEQQWSLVPDVLWAAGPHEIVVDTVLEDLAGNRIGRPFEVDEFSGISKRVVPEFYCLSIEIK